MTIFSTIILFITYQTNNVNLVHIETDIFQKTLDYLFVKQKIMIEQQTKNILEDITPIILSDKENQTLTITTPTKQRSIYFYIKVVFVVILFFCLVLGLNYFYNLYFVGKSKTGLKIEKNLEETMPSLLCKIVDFYFPELRAKEKIKEHINLFFSKKEIQELMIGRYFFLKDCFFYFECSSLKKIDLINFNTEQNPIYELIENKSHTSDFFSAFMSLIKNDINFIDTTKNISELLNDIIGCFPKASEIKFFWRGDNRLLTMKYKDKPVLRNIDSEKSSFSYGFLLYVFDITSINISITDKDKFIELTDLLPKHNFFFFYHNGEKFFVFFQKENRMYCDDCIPFLEKYATENERTISNYNDIQNYLKERQEKKIKEHFSKYKFPADNKRPKIEITWTELSDSLKACIFPTNNFNKLITDYQKENSLKKVSPVARNSKRKKLPKRARESDPY